MKKLLFTLLCAALLAGCSDKRLGNDEGHGGNAKEDEGHGGNAKKEIPDDMTKAFPDNIFRAYVLKDFDIDGDGKISEEEAEKVTWINVNKSFSSPDDEKIASLEGIQYFPNLIILYCSNNKLTEEDVTQNTALTDLSCSLNQLTKLNVTHNPALEILHCQNNRLTTLEVTQNTALTYLYCWSNYLATLDVSKTNLGNSTNDYPLLCSPMDGSGLETLYLKTSWEIPGIYPERDDDYVPANTKILFKD